MEFFDEWSEGPFLQHVALRATWSGDFKLVIDKKTGYFNATKLCISGGKQLKNWLRLQRTKEIIKFCDLSRGSEYEVTGDNNHKLHRQVTGTYVPKELILDVASWISTEFYFRCNSIIINYFVKEFKKMDKNDLNKKIKEVEEKMEKLTLENKEKENVISQQKDKIDQLLDSNHRLETYVRSLGISLEEVKDQNNELLDKTCGLKKKVKDVQRKLGIAVEDRAPLPEDKSKHERFIMLKRNDRDYYGYYVLRAQDAYITRKIKSEKSNFPNLEVLLDFKCNPNSKTLYTRIKESLTAKNVVFFLGTILTLKMPISQKTNL